MFYRKQEQNQVGDNVTQAIGKWTQEDKEFTVVLWEFKASLLYFTLCLKRQKFPQP